MTKEIGFKTFNKTETDAAELTFCDSVPQSEVATEKLDLRWLKTGA